MSNNDYRSNFNDFFPPSSMSEKKRSEQLLKGDPKRSDTNVKIPIGGDLKNRDPIQISSIDI